MSITWAELGKFAKEFGLPVVILSACAVVFWSSQQHQMEQREKEHIENREELAKERQFIRGELINTINRNTEAFQELKDEIARQR